MIKKIHVNKYRKLKDIDFIFSNNLNAISGTNGTCKTSLLHLISNSFQAITKTCDWVNDTNCIKVIKNLNSVVNPKVEALTRGDKDYNDPAHGVKGVLFDVEYFDSPQLGFRRHNSSINSRYALKPKYQSSAADKLPYCPTVYLGLPRLVPYGEFRNDDAVEGIKNVLPQNYKEELVALYNSFTRYSITAHGIQQMGDVKKRSEFTTDKEGIDSNTISAGEDNLYIILAALISLRYYYEAIDSLNTVESVLLIDEFDATLHPAYQIKLLKVLREYSEKYKIQVFFTTHSLTTIENMLKEKDNVIYLVDNVTDIIQIENPDIYKIKMHLQQITKNEIYQDKVVPVFTEDDEARFLIKKLLDYYEDKRVEFKGVPRYLHFVDVNIGADSLIGIFKDLKLLRNTMKAICVLDGDHGSNLSNNIVSLPGKNNKSENEGKSPENLLFAYAEKLYADDSEFWKEKAVLDQGYSKVVYEDRIAKPLSDFKKALESGERSIKQREFNKKLFNDNRMFFDLLFMHWLNNDDNRSEKYRFYTELRQVFRNNALFNGIDPNVWKEV